MRREKGERIEYKIIKLKKKVFFLLINQYQQTRNKTMDEIDSCLLSKIQIQATQRIYTLHTSYRLALMPSFV